jgi:drug/metabolite transporter (DMT)-like permease
MRRGAAGAQRPHEAHGRSAGAGCYSGGMEARSQHESEPAALQLRAALLTSIAGGRRPGEGADSQPSAATPIALTPLLYVALALLFSLLWASAFVAVKTALRDSPPLFLMGTRFLLAGAALLLVAVASGSRLPASRRACLQLVLLGLLNYAGYLGVSAIALQFVTAGMGAVLASTNPLLLTGVAAAVLGERLGLPKLVGLGIALSSVVLIMWSRIGSSSEPLGMLLLLGANGIMVAGTVLFKRWAPQHGLTVLNGVQLLVSGAALTIPSLLLEPVATVRWTPTFLVALLYLVFIVSCGAMAIWFTLLRSGDASKASAYLFLNPVLGLALGALLLAEPLRTPDVLGGLGVGLGVYLVQRAR